MKKTLPAILLTFFLSYLNCFSQSEEQGFSVLNDLQIENKSIKIVTSNTVKYNIFKISNPPRLVVELFNTEHDLKQKETNVDSDLIKRIRTGQFQNQPNKIVRVVIDLNKMVNYEPVQNGNIINLSLFADTSDTSGSSENHVVTENADENSVEPEPAPKRKVIVKKPAVKAKTVSKNYTKKAGSSKDASDEGSSRKTSLILPKTPVTLEYNDADIRDILQIMSIRSGINIIYGQDVTGNVSISLRNVPFDQAFQTILSLRGLTSTMISDNIIRVITPTALKDERQKEITYTKIFPLNFADAAVIQSQINTVLTAQEIKGFIGTDTRTNSLVVTATLEGLVTIEKLLKELDIKLQQVSIEAKIVDVTLNDISDLGVNWTYQNVSKQGSGAGNVAMESINQPLGDSPGLGSQPAEAGANSIQLTEVKTALPVPLGGNFNFGYVTANDALNMRLGALITSGKAKVLSNPRVTTLNNKMATIVSGEKVPYKAITVVNQVSQESWMFLDAGIQLTVTPSISPDGWITLTVLPSVSVPQPSPAGQPPSTKNRSTNVTVIIKDNDTIVIGGLITENDIDNIQRVPVLSDLPILGYFFSYKTKTTARTELLIFITPNILQD
ncbi:MAG: hypothetical protein A2297_01800 [Elusimicrobia bacterium RIFOXYB2_FULL_48_7]|nr:MAG: hypothetical protein A2297_01800 [Elusimicrobia bacterium RIFOXYB2_FULL_48_7]